MATKKRRSSRPRTGQGPTKPGGANEARRERKEQARAAREAAHKRQRRRGTIRRLVTIGVIVVVAYTAIYLIGRAASPEPLSAAAVAAGQAAGCTEIDRPTSSAPGGQHLAEGESFAYADLPATSGPHAPSPLPLKPRVYTEPQAEIAAVHTLEHGSVIVYYRPTGEGGPPQEVVDRLSATVAGKPASYLMPYADLPEGQALAFTAWNQRMFCPAATTADQAATIASGFADSFACTTNSPEPNNGDDC